MKILSLLLLFLTISVHADECSLYEIKGTFRFKNTDALLVINEGTRSEMTLKLKLEDLYKAAPYKDQTSKGIYLLKTPPQKSRIIDILEINKIESDTPNPLIPKEHSYFKELRKTPCSK